MLGKLPKTKQGANSKPNCAGSNFKGKKGYLAVYEVSGFLSELKLTPSEKCDLYD